VITGRDKSYAVVLTLGLRRARDAALSRRLLPARLWAAVDELLATAGSVAAGMSEALRPTVSRLRLASAESESAASSRAAQLLAARPPPQGSQEGSSVSRMCCDLVKRGNPRRVSLCEKLVFC